MFVARQVNDLPSDAQISRQNNIAQVVLYGVQPTTYLQIKAASIVGSAHIDVIKHALVLDNLNQILDEILIGDYNNIREIEAKKRVRQLLQCANITEVSTFILPQKLPILAETPATIPYYPHESELIDLSYANLGEFEHMCFNSNTLYQYYNVDEFASYIYHNILHSLNATKGVSQLETLDVWQAKLALLIYHTEFNNCVARKAFYDNYVKFKGMVYDTSFVPKYDVNHLAPQYKLTDKGKRLNNDAEYIQYYQQLDPQRVRQVPMSRIGIFLVFPFKNGHYVAPDGRIHYVGDSVSSQGSRKSVQLLMQNMCTLNDLEASIESAARMMSVSDATYQALYAANLQVLAVALMVLRRQLGNAITLKDFTIALPTELNILSWLRLTCDQTRILLPPRYKCYSHDIVCVDLIRDIAQSCYNELGACLMAASFVMPEILYNSVHAELRTSAELYVFYTLILQSYPHAMYLIARNSLKNITFGSNTTVNFSKYRKEVRRYYDNTIGERLDNMTEALVLPSAINSNDQNENKCKYSSCPALYEFANDQLRTLVDTKQLVNLNNIQLANLIVLNI